MAICKRLLALVTLLMLSAVPTDAGTKNHTLLGSGRLGIVLPSVLAMTKRVGFEWVSYSIQYKTNAKQILLIYLGNNWKSSGGPLSRIAIGSLKGWESSSNRGGKFDRTVEIDLRRNEAGRRIVFVYSDLPAKDARLADQVIESLSP
jgi:hypothetical protein